MDKQTYEQRVRTLAERMVSATVYIEHMPTKNSDWEELVKSYYPVARIAVAAEWGDPSGGYVHKANGFDQRYGAWEKDTPNKLWDVERIERWNSPATMPREAARLFLRITNIRVMRFSELTNEDAMKQGIYGEPVTFVLNNREAVKQDKYFWIIDFTKCDKP